VITNIGRNILSKYLVGQAQAYASYIAIGVGPKPLIVGEEFPDLSEQQNLDFEVLRMPITTRGFVYDEVGNPNIVFAAEIPSDERYEISEVGIYPGLANPTAGSLDSKIVYNFSEAENWEYHTENAASAIETIVSPLNLDQASGSIAVENDVFRTNSNNTLFSGPIRQGLQERPRFLNRSLLVRGNMSHLVTNGVTDMLEIYSGDANYNASHVHYNSISLDLDPNSADDELRFAFSVLSKDETQAEDPQTVKILMEFAEADVATPVNFARFEVDLTQGQDETDFASNRYFVITKKLSELIKSPGFTWNAVNSVRIYATVFQFASSVPSDNFYIALDGLRFENTTALNPLYGLTGYSLIKTNTGYPIIKESNTSNIIEFRFGLDIA
jgi:hypothetical protein